MTKRKHADGERVFIVYDATAASGDTDDANILESFVAKNDQQARQVTHHMWGRQQYVLYGCTFKDNVAVQDDAPLARNKC